MPKARPQPPRPDCRRSIRGSFSWIDHRFLREGFDQGLTRLEKLLYFVLVAVSNHDGVSFYSDARLAELLDIRFPHELEAARNELVARDLIAYEDGIYQVLDLPVSCSPKKARDASPARPDHTLRSSSSLLPPVRKNALREAARIWRVSSSCWNAGAGDLKVESGRPYGFRSLHRRPHPVPEDVPLRRSRV